MEKSTISTLLFSFFILFFSNNALAQHIAPAELIAKQNNNGFWENKGQISDQFGKPRPDVLYLFSHNAFKLHLKANSFSYELYHIESEEVTNIKDENDQLPIEYQQFQGTKSTLYYHRVDIELIGANSHPQVYALGKSEDYNNYYLAHTPEEGINSVHYYQKVVYKDIYPDIDMVFYTYDQNKGVKYDFIINPGGNPDNIKLQYKGAKDILLTKENELEIYTSEGNIEENIPMSYYKEEPDIRITTTYKQQDSILSFDINNYDPGKTIVIDPVIRLWGTYYGGNDFDEGRGITTDAVNNIILIGNTISTNTIATSGSHQSIHGIGGYDAFIAKFNSIGVRLWGTYYGGSDQDVGNEITTDAVNNIIITGTTKSTNAIATAGSHQSTYGGSGQYSGDAFVAKFNPTGVRIWGTYYGGSNDDWGTGIAIDSNNNIVITGTTISTNAIATPGGHQSIHGGEFDAFVAKFNSTGVRFWGTYYGSGLYDISEGITIDADNNIIIAGDTESKNAISTPGSHQSTYGGGGLDVFIVKFSPFGVRLWGTYYGGTNHDVVGSEIITDAVNNIIITGWTSSTNAIATSGSYQFIHGGIRDAFIAKFNPSGVRLWGTYYGGNDFDEGRGITTDAANNIIISGRTSSVNAITTSGSFQFMYGGGAWDAFIAKFNAYGIRLWGTYYGGSMLDEGIGITTDANNDIIITGMTTSTNSITTSGSHQSTFGGGVNDAFIAKFYDYCMKVDTQPQNNTICVSDTTVFYVIVSSTYSLSYQWEYNDGTGWKNIINGGQFSGTDSNILSISNITYSMHNNTYRCNITNICESKYSSSATINIMIPDFSINDTFQCLNENDFVFNNTTNVFDSCLWAFGDDKFSNRTNASHTYDTTGMFPAKLISFSSLCSDSIIKNIIVNPNPKANFSINDTSQCLTGNMFQFTDSSNINVGSIISWQWNFGNGNTTNDTTATNKYNTSDTFNVSLIVGSDVLCTDTIAKQVILHPMPESAFFIPDSSQCFDRNYFIFVNTSNISSGKLSYLWNFGDNDTSTLGNPHHSYLYPDTFTVKLNVMSNFGCKDTTSGTTYIHVHPRPFAAFSINDSVQCLEENIFRFTNLSTIQSGSFTTLWDFGDTDTSTSFHTKHTYNTYDTFNTKLLLVSDYGCKDSTSKIVYIYPSSTAGFTVSNYCVGDSTIFKNTSKSTIDSLTSFLWNFGDGLQSIGSGDLLHMYDKPGTYLIQLVSSTNNNCRDTALKTITVYSKPTIDIIIDSDTLIYHGEKVVLTVFGIYDSILWSTGNNENSIIVTDGGIYSVRVVDTTGCSNTKEIRIIICEIPVFETVNTITPNEDGINDYWKIFDIDKYSPCQVNIFNRWGDELFSSSDYKNDWAGTWKGENVSEGTYYYVVKDKNGAVYKGFVNVLR